MSDDKSPSTTSKPEDKDKKKHPKPEGKESSGSDDASTSHSSEDNASDASAEGNSTSSSDGPLNTAFVESDESSIPVHSSIPSDDEPPSKKSKNSIPLTFPTPESDPGVSPPQSSSALLPAVYSSSDSSDLEATIEGGTYRICGFINSPILKTGQSLTFCCPLDSFLVAIKIAMLRTRYIFISNFSWKDGPGFRLETALQELVPLFVLRERKTGRRLPDLDVATESFNIQSMWLEYCGGTNNQTLAGCEGSRVFDFTGEVSRFNFAITCPESELVYEKEYETAWFHTQDELNRLVENQNLPISRPSVLAARCSHPNCSPSQYSTQISIPATSWLFVIQNYQRDKENGPDIIDTYPEQIVLNQNNPDGSTQKVIFRKAYTSFTRYTRGKMLSHLVSVHRIKSELFYFDDLSPDATLKVTRSTLPPSTDSRFIYKLSSIVFFRLPADQRLKKPGTPEKSIFRSPADQSG